ncbi:ABC-F family ATP-binding cassette domain-containing protein [Brevibacterium marinum]|uniref:ATPase subunit of ABC transporter with duplicated ATPase domains n=1 Tax=Brevibacterium marinum TaxID=418643 RepID=A0A846RV09_9MICO|nr:ATP-binding cassette domain-containing protein [Brevibacterium marinum]NJC57629.1 ATPase subunit of ABC transporter with duplicated ATPase domains [Brevibacterium marinum]
MTAAISISDLGYRLGDDTEIFTHLSASIPAAVVGLVGENGVGKSTLARIIAGTLSPTAGSVTGAEAAVYIDQLLPYSEDSVASAMGITTVRTALAKALSGDAEPADFEAIGDDWDIEERALGTLAELDLKLDANSLDRPLSTFSGGQAVRIGLARAAMAGERWLILDEPSNNLDEAGRGRLVSLLEQRRGPTLVISHDRALLATVTTIVEMTDGLQVYGGDFEDYETMVAAEEEAKLARVVDAKKSLAIEKRQRIELETKLARAERKAAKDKENKRRPKIVMNGLTGFAQKSAAKRRGDKAADEAAARSSVQSAKDALRRDSSIRLDLPETVVHSGKRVLDIEGPPLLLPRSLVGPERIRLTGANGSGKSTLLAALTGRADTGAPVEGLFPGLRINTPVPIGYLDQQYRLPSALTVMAAVREGNPDLGPHRVHEVLAAMGLRAGRTDQLCSTLSGGERFRVALAATLLQDPAPQLLVLDEPGNNLDLPSLRALVTALDGFGGAMIVVTHDDRLARELRLDVEWGIREFLVPERVDMDREGSEMEGSHAQP